MARSVAFGAHLKKPAKNKKQEAWRSLIKPVVVTLENGKKRKAYQVKGVDGWFAWANAVRVAKGHKSRRSRTSVRAQCQRGEISKAQAKSKLGYVPKACK